MSDLPIRLEPAPTPAIAKLAEKPPFCHLPYTVLSVSAETDWRTSREVRLPIDNTGQIQ